MVGEHKSGSQSYPVVRQDDAIEGAEDRERTAGERRSFARGRQASPIDESWLGPRGDPAEGKR